MATAVALWGAVRRWSTAAWLRPEGFLATSSIPLLCNSYRNRYFKPEGRWERKNNVVYPPQQPGEPRRPAEIHHCRRDIEYSNEKMWYLAKMATLSPFEGEKQVKDILNQIRGMSIDQALAQLEFNDKKGAKIIKEVLLEAQELAVRDYNVEFKSNLHIERSFSGRGKYTKAIRFHGRGRYGIMFLNKCHYFVKLVEGPPPPPLPPKTGFDQAKEYVQGLRDRTITHTL